MTNTPKTRRLSPWRVLAAIIIFIAVVGAGTYGAWQWWTARVLDVGKPWFASYVDVTATPSFAFDQLGATATRDAVLSFIVSSPKDPCTPTWGSVYTLGQASGALDLDRRIARLQQQGGSVAISFGGHDNQELAVGCSDSTKLAQAYQSVISRYNISTIDLDIEGSDLGDANASARRATVIASLQQARRSEGKPLAIWLTVPVSPDGLTINGTTTIATLLAQGVDLAGINAMTMDYGTSLSHRTMIEADESALVQTERQLGILYEQAHIHLSNQALWSKLGATPMIGQNDDTDEVFTVNDAKQFNQFAINHAMGRLSMWSANRDVTCGSNYVDVTIVSSSCSGITQAKEAFSQALGSGFDGSIALSASLITKSNSSSSTSSTAQTPDDPANSPYQIWSTTGAYLEGTKVVWHHNVYQAKWWTQGDLPDNPVLQSWQTPWELIGPVLPGEKPIPQPTLPAGTYPDWSGTTTYNAGDRVLLSGVPYQAKWWNQGNSPAATSSNPDNSPWAPLTQAQINQVESGK